MSQSLSKKIENEILADLADLNYIREKIAEEMAKTVRIALKIRDLELVEQEKRNQQKRKEFNEQYESYIKATTNLAHDLVDKRDSNIPVSLSKINHNIIALLDKIWADQQQAFAAHVANRLSRPITLSNGQTLTPSETSVKQIQKNLSELPLPPDDTAELTEGRNNLYKEHIAKYDNAPTIDQDIDARIQVANRFNDARRRAHKERMIITKGLRDDFNFNPVNHDAHHAFERVAVEIVDEARIRQLEQLAMLLIISRTLSERLHHYANDPRMLHEKFTSTLARHGWTDEAPQISRSFR